MNTITLNTLPTQQRTSPYTNTIEYAFHLLKSRLKGETLQNNQVKDAAFTSLENISKDECLVMCVGHQLDLVIASKVYTTKY